MNCSAGSILIECYLYFYFGKHSVPSDISHEPRENIMQDIEPNETEIKGQWVLVGAKMQADDACKRIEWLLENRLKELGSNEQWESLHLDLSDNRYWLRTYPESHMHGGGPPLLQCIAKSEAMLWQLRLGSERG